MDELESMKKDSYLLPPEDYEPGKDVEEDEGLEQQEKVEANRHVVDIIPLRNSRDSKEDHPILATFQVPFFDQKMGVLT